ncbi:MAG TPA: hypothetical protein DCQ13_02410 [Firmicutes bacterium]|nr:hypothetical protein [Bacillota bacterium]
MPFGSGDEPGNTAMLSPITITIAQSWGSMEGLLQEPRQNLAPDQEALKPGLFRLAMSDTISYRYLGK